MSLPRLVALSAIALACLGAPACKRSAGGGTPPPASTVRPDSVENGSFSGVRRFAFTNFAVAEIDGGAGAEFEVRRFHVNGNAFRVPYRELRVTTHAGTFLLTDRGTSNGWLVVDGERREADVRIDRAGAVTRLDEPASQPSCR